MLDAGHGGQDPGAVGYDLAEKDITLVMALRAEATLKANYVVDVEQTRTRDVFISLEARTNKANAWGADLFYSFHVNAGGGTGYEDYIYNGPLNEETKQIREIIHSYVWSKVLKPHDIRDRGKKRANFHVLRETYMSAVLAENLFIDTRRDANKLKNPAFLNALADAQAHGMAAALDLPKRNKQEKDALYIVQAGAFRNYDGAKKHAAAIQKKGFDCYVDKEGNLYKVQAGAFSEKENAERQVAALKRAGFDAFYKREG